MTSVHGGGDHNISEPFGSSPADSVSSAGSEKQVEKKTKSILPGFLERMKLTSEQKKDYTDIKAAIGELQQKVDNKEITHEHAKKIQSQYNKMVEASPYHKEKLQHKMENLNNSIAGLEYAALKQNGHITAENFNSVLNEIVLKDGKPVADEIRVNQKGESITPQIVRLPETKIMKDTPTHKQYITQIRSDIVQRGDNVKISYVSNGEVKNSSAKQLWEECRPRDIEEEISELSRDELSSSQKGQYADILKNKPPESRKSDRNFISEHIGQQKSIRIDIDKVKTEFGDYEKEKYADILKTAHPGQTDQEYVISHLTNKMDANYRNKTVDQMSAEINELSNPPLSAEQKEKYKDILNPENENDSKYVINQLKIKSEKQTIENIGNKVMEGDLSDKYKHILALKPKDSELSDKEFVVMHMLFLGSQNSFNEFANISGETGLSGVYPKTEFLVDFNSLKVCCSQTANKLTVDEKKFYNDKKGKSNQVKEGAFIMTMEINCNKPGCDTASKTELHIYNQGKFSNEDFKKGFTRPA